MKRICKIDWRAFDNMTNDEVIAGAASDPDGSPFCDGAKVNMRKEDGATVLERFRKPIKRERQDDFRAADTDQILFREE